MIGGILLDRDWSWPPYGSLGFTNNRRGKEKNGDGRKGRKRRELEEKREKRSENVEKEQGKERNSPKKKISKKIFFYVIHILFVLVSTDTACAARAGHAAAFFACLGQCRIRGIASRHAFRAYVQQNGHVFAIFSKYANQNACFYRQERK